MNLFGFFLALIAGLIGGFAPAPLKGIKRLQYEHWGLIVGLFGYLVFPWAFLFYICPDTCAAIAELPLKPLLIGNALSLAWGVANILYLICMVKIGFSLAQGILVGIAIPTGVLIPMILKGSGNFANAPDIFSLTGLFIVISVLIMLTAVVLLSKAGFGREEAQNAKSASANSSPNASSDTADGENCTLRTAHNSEESPSPSGFTTYLIMSVLAGLLSVGISFSFVYTEKLITEVFANHGLSQNFTPAAVRAVTITGGGILNVLYPLFLLTKNHSWKGFACEHNVREMLFALIIAAVTTTSVVMASTGQIMLGALGSSVGFGVGQSMQLAGSQIVAFVSGEWKGVPRKHVIQVITAMVLLLVAVGVISVLS